MKMPKQVSWWKITLEYVFMPYNLIDSLKSLLSLSLHFFFFFSIKKVR